MNALQVMEAQIYRDTLLDIPAVLPLVILTGSSPPQYKIFWENVPENIPLDPAYITTHHINGGREKDPTYSDTVWKIVGHTANMQTAVDLANAISGLSTKDPVTSSYVGVCGYHYIEEVLPIFDRYTVQKTPFFQVGGLYRMKLNLGDN